MLWTFAVGSTDLFRIIAIALLIFAYALLIAGGLKEIKITNSQLCIKRKTLLSILNIKIPLSHIKFIWICPLRNALMGHLHNDKILIISIDDNKEILNSLEFYGVKSQQQPPSSNYTIDLGKPDVTKWIIFSIAYILSILFVIAVFIQILLA